MENGLPQNTVQALAQTKDGFIWLGTEVGLVRFDGNGFQVFDQNSSPALPGNDVRCLLAASDGALWIGTSEGLARWKDGTERVYGTKEGLPGNSIVYFLSEDNGAIQLLTESGPAHLSGGRFVAEKPADPFPVTANGESGESRVNVVFEDLLVGGIWLGGDRSALSLEAMRETIYGMEQTN